MRLAPMMRLVPILSALMVAGVAGAQVPPPAPARDGTAPQASAWACTRKTLLDELPCTVEGRTEPASPSRVRAQENQRAAEVLAGELCTALASGEAAAPDAGILAVCTARVAAATRRCGGDGSRRLTDDAGRFNPGHAACYAGLAALVRDIGAVVGSAQGCCACVHDACNGDEQQCVARMADEQAPAVSAACLSGVCGAACAQARLFSLAPPRSNATAPSARPSSRKP